MSIDLKILSKIFTNEIKYFNNTGMQELYNIHKSINIIQHINTIKDKNPYHHTIDAEKAFAKIQHLFMIKALKKLRIEGTFLNIIKAIDDKPITNIILNGEKLKPFPPKSEMRQGCPPFPLLLNIVLEFLARSIRQEKEIQGIQIRNEEVKLFLLANDTILYLKDPKNSTKKSFRPHKLSAK
jgi:hypothetical protein